MPSNTHPLMAQPLSPSTLCLTPPKSRSPTTARVFPRNFNLAFLNAFSAPTRPALAPTPALVSAFPSPNGLPRLTAALLNSLARIPPVQSLPPAYHEIRSRFSYPLIVDLSRFRYPCNWRNTSARELRIECL